MPSSITCPKCGRPQKPGEGQRIFYCDHCKMQFDDEPEEGGDYSAHNPAARLEREERRAAQPKRRK